MASRPGSRRHFRVRSGVKAPWEGSRGGGWGGKSGSLVFQALKRSNFRGDEDLQLQRDRDVNLPRNFLLFSLAGFEKQTKPDRTASWALWRRDLLLLEKGVPLVSMHPASSPPRLQPWGPPAAWAPCLVRGQGPFSPAGRAGAGVLDPLCVALGTC